LLIGYNVDEGLFQEIEAGKHPRADYFALAQELNADIASFASINNYPGIAARAMALLLGKRLALAIAGFLESRRYKLIFVSGEDIAIPLCAMLRLRRNRPEVITIAHRLTPLKKRIPWILLDLQQTISKAVVYSKTQREFAVSNLLLPEQKVIQIPFQADHLFFKPNPAIAEKHQICSAGLEWRDYPTLIEAVRNLDVSVKIAAASLWSKHRDETRRRRLPPNVEARPYKYPELRTLYAESKIVVVPLYETDFQAGITTVLEAMAMAKPVIVSRTSGQTDTIVDGETGIYVPPSDAVALRQAIEYLLRNPQERARLGRNARRAIEEQFSLDHFVARIKALADGSRTPQPDLEQAEGAQIPQLNHSRASIWSALTQLRNLLMQRRSPQRHGARPQSRP